MAYLPLIFGMMLNHLFCAKLKTAKLILPELLTIILIFLVAITIALYQPKLASIGLIVLVAVILHHMMGILCGYGAGHLSGLTQQECRTIAIEVGMQNSGFSGYLAAKYLSATAFLPSITFTAWQNIPGIILGKYWSKNVLEKS